MVTPFIIMPVKDSWETTEQAIRSIIASGHSLLVYDDNSSAENAARLEALRDELGIELIHIGERTNHLSPNYRWVLLDAQRTALERGSDLIIVESDVMVKADTISSLCTAVQQGVGMVAAVTTDEQGQINFPYEYAQKIKTDGPCTKRFSFCCTLLTNAFLQAYDFAQLNERKDWYDVYISRKSRQLGFVNILQVTNPVLHKPHSSRPWKQLKYSHPFLYYWNKLIHGRDKI